MGIHTKKILSVFGCLHACFVSYSALAYEVGTHSEMSTAAYDQSVLSKPDIFKTFGISAIDVFDKDRADSRPPKLNDGTARGWIREGAVVEDRLLRPINHFYDPVSGEALLPLLAKASPTWALEDQGSILLPLWQRYSLADAHDYLHKALRLPDRTERDENFGLAFEILGRMIHHIQGMAQPQHVRIDTHLRLSDSDRPDWFFERGSRYESHTKGLGGNLPFSGYPSVMFDTARKFWTSQGRGLADFTNRNFLSACPMNGKWSRA